VLRLNDEPLKVLRLLPPTERVFARPRTEQVFAEQVFAPIDLPPTRADPPRGKHPRAGKRRRASATPLPMNSTDPRHNIAATYPQSIYAHPATRSTPDAPAHARRPTRPHLEHRHPIQPHRHPI